MRLVWQHHVVKAEDLSDRERSALRVLLYFKDPNASKIYDYKEGVWDGMRDFFLDAEQTLFPSGFLSRVLAGLAIRGIQPEVSDERNPVPKPVCEITVDMLQGIELRPYQIEGCQKALAGQKGVINAAPRSGKTEMQIAVAAALDVRSVLLVEKTSLMEQHYERFLERGIRSVGRLGSMRREIDCQHVVATFQTIHSALIRGKEEIYDWLQEIELAQCDEVHHLGSASTYYHAFARIPAPYRLGYSGTPFRHDPKDEAWNHADFNLLGATGKLLYHVSSRFLRDEGYLVEPTVYIVKIMKPALWHVKNWQNAYRMGIVQNGLRNEIIVKTTKMLHDAGERTLILIKELKHGETLLKALSKVGVPCIMSSGGQQLASYDGRNLNRSTGGPAKIRAMLEEGQITTVVGSVIYDEGVDIPTLSALVVASGGKSNIKAIQRAFRAMTAAEGKTKSLIFDFDDHTNFMLRNHTRERIKVYKAEDIKVVERLPHAFRKAIGA